MCVQVHMCVHVLVVCVEAKVNLKHIPQALSSLFCETESLACLELNKWLSWLTIQPRGCTHLSLPVLGLYARATMSSFFTWILRIRLRSS